MIIDITQELFSGKVYPGDPEPKLTVIRSGGYNLSKLECCAHNGTHIDAPLHIGGSGDIEAIDLNKCMGICAVMDSPPNDAANYKKIIIRGQLTAAQAEKLTGLDLIGTNEQTIGNEEVHRLLLDSGVVILEGLMLDNVSNGEYTLIALPLKLRGADGAPVRAILTE